MLFLCSTGIKTKKLHDIHKRMSWSVEKLFSYMRISWFLLFHKNLLSSHDIDTALESHKALACDVINGTRSLPLICFDCPNGCLFVAQCKGEDITFVAILSA